MQESNFLSATLADIDTQMNKLKDIGKKINQKNKKSWK